MSGKNGKIHFGLQTAQQGVSYDVIRDHWQLLERLGYDSVWVIDHLFGVGEQPEAVVAQVRVKIRDRLKRLEEGGGASP